MNHTDEYWTLPKKDESWLTHTCDDSVPKFGKPWLDTFCIMIVFTFLQLGVVTKCLFNINQTIQLKSVFLKTEIHQIGIWIGYHLFHLIKYVWNANTFNNLSSDNLINWMHLITVHIVISVLSLDNTLQTLLTSFDKKVGLKASPDDLRVRKL